ncbi:MAG: hypothetical protein FWG80_04140 [Alphaproteobacteria bacterium]|nr:hypothetical protein [Alphaproteobacteria bacterium]
MATLDTLVTYPDHSRYGYLWNDLSNRSDFRELIDSKLLDNLSCIDFTKKDSGEPHAIFRENNASWIEFDSRLKKNFIVTNDGRKPHTINSLFLKPITGACNTFDMPTKCRYYNTKGCHYCENPTMVAWRKTMNDFSL